MDKFIRYWDPAYYDVSSPGKVDVVGIEAFSEEMGYTADDVIALVNLKPRECFEAEDGHLIFKV